MPDDIETRVTSETGGQKGEKLPKLGGADPLAMLELARVYGYGEEKYDRFNYLKGYPWSLSIDALSRHFLAFQNGESTDPESGRHHMAHVAWHGLALTAFDLRQLGTDDRYKPPVDEVAEILRKVHKGEMTHAEAMRAVGLNPDDLTLP